MNIATVSIDLNRSEVGELRQLLTANYPNSALASKFCDLHDTFTNIEGGALTHSSQLKKGMVVYHVYGHLPRRPSREVVTREPYSMFSRGTIESVSNVLNEQMPGPPIVLKEEKCHAFDVQPEGQPIRRRMIGDCGLDGANHNHNRLFFTLEAAHAFIDSCIAEGIRNPF